MCTACRPARLMIWSKPWACQSGRIVSVAVIVAVGVNSDGRREVLGMAVGPSEAETFWTEFLARPAWPAWRQAGDLRCQRRHQAAISKVLHATWQRCRGVVEKLRAD